MKDVEEESGSGANGIQEYNGAAAALPKMMPSYCQQIIDEEDENPRVVIQPAVPSMTSTVKKHVKKYIPSFLQKAKPINRRKHLRKKSSVREIFEQGLEVVMEDVHLTARDVQHAFVGELQGSR